jgi:RNA polymerase sigma factor (sigma-70 family)
MNPAKGSTVISYLRRTLCAPAPAHVSDDELLGRFVGHRDEAAFTALVRRHGPMVWSICQRVLGQCQDAEDAFQATFLVLAAKAGSIGRRKLLANWLFGVARRAALNVRSMRSRRARHERSYGDLPELTAIAETPRDNVGTVMEELGRMPQKYRLPLLLCGLEGMTHAEAGHYLGWPKGTVAGRLWRARELLRARLLRRGVTTPAALTAILAANAAEAAVPPQVLAASVRTAMAFMIAGQSGAAVVSPAATTLMSGILTKMFVARAVKMGALMVALVMIAGGAAVAWQLPLAADPSSRADLRRPFGHPAPPAPAHTNLWGEPSIRLPADPSAIVLRMERCLQSAAEPVFALTIHADGRVVAEVRDDSSGSAPADMTKSAQDGAGADNPKTGKLKVLEGKLSTQDLQELLRFAIQDQAFFDFDAATVKAAISNNYASGDVADLTDGTTTCFRVQTRDRGHEVKWPGLAKAALRLGCAMGEAPQPLVKSPGPAKALLHIPEVEHLRQLYALNRRLSQVFQVLRAGGQERVEAVVSQMNELALPHYQLYAGAPRLTAADLTGVAASPDGSGMDFTFVRVKDKTFFRPLFGISIHVPQHAEPRIRYVIPPQ